jgi:hypothetical protein
VTKVCAVAFESFFKKAVLFKDARCDEVSQKCLEAFASYGLRPTQIAFRTGDQMFNYDVSFSLFNGNGTFRISAEKLDVSLQNAASEKDLEIVEDCVTKIYGHVPLPDIHNTSISANAQATFASKEALQEFLTYANPTKQIVWRGTIAYILLPTWPEEIRLMADRSVIYPDGVFSTWNTAYKGNKISRDVLKNVKDVFEKALTTLGLTFPKPN